MTNEKKVQAKAKAKEYAAMWWKSHRKEQVIRQRNWRKNNRQKCYQQHCAWKEANKENFNRLSASWRERNPKYNQQWHKENPEKGRALSAKRRARIHGNGGSFTVEQWKSLCEKYHNKCLACGQVKPLTADHIIPVTKGGTSWISNIQPLCRECNSAKGTRVIDYRYLED